ncbi:spindle pole body component 110-like [Sebastes umbrosus]|uniref:spindle pole body component 110-like n=1 Tax=Sebastes umbrosus TaxID=72105 RepID=UPI00189D12E6|nr:spindle pole body component 110-like [Sebastes umbrosus]
MAQSHPEDDVGYQHWCRQKIRDLELCDLREKQWLRVIKANTIKIDTLETENQTLKEELKLSKEKYEDLEIKTKSIDDKNLNFAQTWYYTEKKHIEWKKKQEQSEEAHRQQLHDCQENCRKTKAELELKQTSLLAGYRRKLAEALADAQTTILQEKDRLDQEHKEKLVELKVELSRELEEFITEVKKSRKEEKEKEKVLVADYERHKTLHTTSVVKCGTLEKEIVKLKITITNLLNREDLTPEVSSLEKTVKENNREIARKNREIADSQERIHQLRESFCNGNKKQAVLQDKLNKETNKTKGLVDELEGTQSELNRTKMNLRGAKLDISDLENKILDLQCRLKTCEPDLIKQTERSRKLQTQLLRFQNDLELCMPSISDTSKFKSSVTAVKHRHVDGNIQVQHPMDKENESAFRDHIPRLKKMITSYDRVRQNDKRVAEQQYVKTRQRVLDLGHTQFKIINEQRMEMYTMRKERKMLEEKLKWTEKLLQKATKPAAKKVKSWIKEKVLRTHSKVAPEVEPEVAEETPPRYIVDMVVPLRPPDDMSSSSQPLDDGTEHARQFVDNDLTCVDI